MNKLWLIIKREYLTRVRKKSFLLITIGTPLAIALFMVLVAFILNSNKDNLKVGVIDESQTIMALKDTETIDFEMIKNSSLDKLRDNFEESEYDGLVVISDFKSNLTKTDYKFNYYSDKPIGSITKNSIGREIGKKIRNYKVEQSNLDEKTINDLKASVDLKEIAADKEKEKEDGSSTENRSEIATGIGMFLGLFMYFVIFFYGSMIMRSVMEEKTNRIVEVMISSVKPFQLMLGKIIGVSGVGLTQIIIWAIMFTGLSFVIGMIIPVDPSAMEGMNTNSGIDPEDMESMVSSLMDSIFAVNWTGIISVSILFFIGGYFLYSSLFAAVGSAMGDDMGEGQALTIPISIPVVLALYIMIAVVQNPNSSMATWSSFVPFFSPIIVPARMAFDPPLWEIILSLVILAVSAIFFVWLSGRIYRVGILMYGKKITFKELGKWLFYRD